jgi:D-glycero-D-manno-heptose 1,7-bisphosphate phosphatase
MRKLLVQARPALFLDRDGVINVEKNYVYSIEDFEFVDGIFELCRAAKQQGMSIVVVTNQAGIGRGFYSEEQFRILTDWMRKRFAEEGAPIDAVYFCPFHPEHGVGEYRRDSYDRKPNPGMIFRARDELDLDLSLSILVGDKESDIMAAKAAGVGFTVLLGEDSGSAMPSTTIQSLSDACAILMERPIGARFQLVK